MCMYVYTHTFLQEKKEVMNNKFTSDFLYFQIVLYGLVH